MKKIYTNAGYIADPHGAVGYLGLKKYGLNKDEFGVFLETAHPVKFLDVVEQDAKIINAIRCFKYLFFVTRFPPNLARLLEY